MAFTALADKIQAGSLVYESFYPQNPGIVRKIVSDTIQTHPHPQYSHIKFRVMLVEVEWLKATKQRAKTTTVNVELLMDFDSLIEDHRRKHEKQSDMAAKLRKM